MITNEAELSVIQEQLARVDAVLESLRIEVKPKSERMFNLFAESPLEMRRELQADIDAYLAGSTSPRDDASESAHANGATLSAGQAVRSRVS